MKSVASHVGLFLLAASALAGCGAGGAKSGTEEPVRAAFPYAPNYLDNYTSRQRWSKSDLGVFVDGGAESRSVASVRQAVLAGANRWVDPIAGVLAFHLVDSADLADIVVRFVAPTDPDVAGTQLGLTRVEFLETSPYLTLTRATITLESGLSDAMVQAAAGHEVGHAIGLISRTPGAPQHSDDTADLMYPVIHGTSTVSLRDANSVAKLYAEGRATAVPAGAPKGTITVHCER